MSSAQGDASGLVTVVIPFFNRARTLGRALDSAIAQTYTRWEIVLVDDGSTDTSLAVAERYARDYPGRIRVLRQANGGPGVARNTGIKDARGSYIAFLDSDDEWSPTFIERVLVAFEACPEVDWIYVNVRRMGENGAVIIPSVFDDQRAGPFRKLKTRSCAHLNVIEDPGFLETAIAYTVKEGANSIVRRNVFDRVTYHPTIRFGEDRILTMSAIAAGFRFGYIDEILMTKFHHGENISIIDEREIDKIMSAQAELIFGLKYIEHALTLNHRERQALRVRLSKHYLEYARLMIDGKRDFLRPVPYLIRAVVTHPARGPALSAIGRKIRNRLGRANISK